MMFHSAKQIGKICVLGLALFSASASWAGGFLNGGFETGTAASWQEGSGTRVGDNNNIAPNDFLPGGQYYDASMHHSSVVSAGLMAHTDGKLNQVYNGNYSYRVEDMANGYGASTIAQTVNNYTDNKIYFAWAATLESEHALADAATFNLVVHDNTSGLNILSRSYTASSDAPTNSIFARSTDGYFYTKNWQVEDITIDPTLQGHSFSLGLMAADCEWGGHQGQVYLDAFGATAPVPEPETYALMLLGVTGLLVTKLRKRS